MLDRRAMIVGLELLNQCLHLLGFATRADQHGVRGRHDDHVIEPDHRGEDGFLGPHQAVAALEHDHGTVGGIAGGVMIEDVPDGAPAADIRPTQIGRNDRRELRALHDRIVDRFLRRAGEGFARQPQKIEVASEAGDGRLGGLGHRRLAALDLAEHGRGVE